LWSLGKKLGRLAQPLQRFVLGTVLDPARAWTKTRDLPPLAKESFKDWWRKRK
jgi:L-lactate dehydrogenase complex protein LldF